MNHLDLFSGIGGFGLAARMAGIEFSNTYFSDIEEYAIQVYQKNFPEAVPLGDIHNIDGRELRSRHDGPWIVTGGFPCQDISTAGKQRGISGGLSSLWFEMHRIIDELRPEVVIAENVSALCSSGLERVLFSLARSGYDAEWQTISAKEVGAPHLRKRVWIVAYPHSLPVHSVGEAPAQARGLGNSFQPYVPHDWSSSWSDRSRILSTGTMGTEPCIYRMDDGLSPELDSTLSRIKACGNAIVPQVAAGIFERIKPLLEVKMLKQAG